LNSSALKAATGVFQEAKQEDRTRPPISGVEQADRGSTSSLTRSMEQQGQDAPSRDPRVRISYVSPPRSHPRHYTPTNTTKVRGSLSKAPPVKFFSPQALDEQEAVLRRPLRLRHPGPERTRRRAQSERSSGSGTPPLQNFFRMRVTEDARTRLISRLLNSCTQLLARFPRIFLTSIGKNGPRPNGP
jgi:hypothetical protein